MASYRKMVISDIDAGMRLCQSAGWNQTIRDWQFILGQNPNGCIVAESGNSVVGTLSTLKYQNHFSWIGMVLVDPEFQHHGIGMQLLRNALFALEQESTIKLDATPAGKKVYLKLNFIEEYTLSRMIANTVSEFPKASSIRNLEEKDLEAVSKFDEQVFGADRNPLLEWLRKNA